MPIDSMKITFENAAKTDAGIAVVPVFGEIPTTGTAAAYRADSCGQIEAALKAARFSGAKGTSVSIYAPHGSQAECIHFTGEGSRADFDAELFGARAMQAFRSTGAAMLSLHLDGISINPEEAARAALGARLAAYRFDKYRTKLPVRKATTVTGLRVIVDDAAKAAVTYAGFHGPVGDGQILARDLVNEPSNVLFPKAYAERIQQLASLGLEIEILGEKEMAALGMHALLGVGKGSRRESQLVVMKWNGGKSGDKPVCLIGKGVTFDSGGISIKPAAGMWDMKGDMGGSAAVVGAMHAAASRKAKVNVIGIVGLAENMPDGDAQNPGDIVVSMSGQTIEVQNTDAEGRLVLADALWYAKEQFQPAAMVNLATLTGAIVIALGSEYAGLFSNSDDVANGLAAASASSTEKIWRMPLAPEYDKMLDSPNADMKNIGGRAAGSITAAQFLQRFVGEVPWAHLDIAGVATKETRADPREPSFATGFGVRLLSQWLADCYESE